MSDESIAFWLGAGIMGVAYLSSYIASRVINKHFKNYQGLIDEYRETFGFPPPEYLSIKEIRQQLNTQKLIL